MCHDVFCHRRVEKVQNETIVEGEEKAHTLTGEELQGDKVIASVTSVEEFSERLDENLTTLQCLQIHGNLSHCELTFMMEWTIASSHRHHHVSPSRC